MFNNFWLLVAFILTILAFTHHVAAVGRGWMGQAAAGYDSPMRNMDNAAEIPNYENMFGLL